MPSSAQHQYIFTLINRFINPLAYELHFIITSRKSVDVTVLPLPLVIKYIYKKKEEVARTPTMLLYGYPLPDLPNYRFAIHA